MNYYCGEQAERMGGLSSAKPNGKRSSRRFGIGKIPKDTLPNNRFEINKGTLHILNG